MKLTSSHWGVGQVETDGDRITAVHPHPADPDPSRLNENIAGSLNGRARVLRPAVRASWLEGKPGERGRDPFVEVAWDEVLDLIADVIHAHDGLLDHLRSLVGDVDGTLCHFVRLARPVGHDSPPETDKCKAQWLFSNGDPCQTLSKEPNR